MEKLKIPFPVIVEGKYDRLRLLNIIEAQIITTDGFGLFRRDEKAVLIRALASRSRIIVLTDSDGAGKVIRSHITQLVPPERLIQLYIPRLEGKEKRKLQPSAEGTLGVEGMENDLLYRLLEPYSDPQTVNKALENPLSKTDFYIDGYSGGEGSAAKRDLLAASLGLPPGMSANALLAAVRMICPYEKYLKISGRNDGK